MKLQNLTVIFIIIIIPIILIESLYISTGLKTIRYQALYDTGLLTATHDAIYAFEQNTINDEYSANPETKRDILKSSIKMFEKSLCNSCGISSYNTDEIEEYIPAIVFGMYDGFYMYAPSKKYDNETGKTSYTHSLKNYVYYSETFTDGTVIRYSLDNYVVVSGDFGNGYEVKQGYLIDLNGSNEDGTKYKGITINKENINGEENTDGIKYYKDAYKFTDWFLNKAEMHIKTDLNGQGTGYLYIGNNGNDPEDESSEFVKHKRQVIKNKIENVLNSSITAYSQRLFSYNYKMPKLSEEDWQKIYNNISMITFFQGKSIGLTKYNGYCVLNSTNSNEYVNPNLMYFIDNNGEYHDIRCDKCKVDGVKLNGYKIGDFRKRKIEEEVEIEKDDGTKDLKTITKYIYNHPELACYDCVNGQINTSKSVFEYIDENPELETYYWTSLARERYNTTKLLEVKGEEVTEITAKTKDVEIIPASGHTIEDVKNGNLRVGDIVKYGDYEYHYNQYRDPDTEGKPWKNVDSSYIWQDGWNAKVIDDTKTIYDNVVKKIFGVDLKGMSGTFYNCKNLIETIDIPDTVVDMTITYEGCSSLEKVTSIGKNVKGLRGTFWYCTELKTVKATIPESVTNMYTTFCGCKNLAGDIIINSNNIIHMKMCFSSTIKSITLKGNSTQKQDLANTANNNNVKVE